MALAVRYGVFDNRAIEVWAAAVNGVSFFDVDEQELNLAFIFVEKSTKPTGFVAERRSGVTSKYHRHRFLVLEAR